jgi:hypothetical protein
MKERLANKVPEPPPPKKESDIEIRSNASRDKMSEILEDQAKLPPKYNGYNYPSNELELKALLKQLEGKSLAEVKQEGLLVDTRDPNFLKLLTADEFGIDAGARKRNKVQLRSFHDRLYKEPRGRFKTYNRTDGLPMTCATHDEWLKGLVNDPLFLVSFQLSV